MTELTDRKFLFLDVMMIFCTTSKAKGNEAIKSNATLPFFSVVVFGASFLILVNIAKCLLSRTRKFYR